NTIAQPSAATASGKIMKAKIFYLCQSSAFAPSTQRRFSLMSDMILQLIPFLIVGAIFVIPNYRLAAKLGSPAVVMAILTIIPFIGYFITIYLIYHAIFTLLDRK